MPEVTTVILCTQFQNNKNSPLFNKAHNTSTTICLMHGAKAAVNDATQLPINTSAIEILHDIALYKLTIDIDMKVAVSQARQHRC